MIHHLALRSHWLEAQRTGRYPWSTLGRTVEQEGFVHLSSDTQWPVVRAAFYRDVTEPLVLLHVDESLLNDPLVVEVGNPATGETFPHLYGPLPVEAVVGTTELAPPHG